MKFLAKLEEQRPFLKLYHDDSITAVNINRMLNQNAWGGKAVKELQDIVNSLRASNFITHFTHHSSETEVREAFNANQQILACHSSLDPAKLNQQYPNQLQKQQEVRQSISQQLAVLQQKVGLVQQIKQIIQQALPDNKSIKYLDLAKTFMKDELAEGLAKMFVDNNDIFYLNLAYNDLTEKGGTAIAGGLARNNSLIHLDLSHNSLNPKSIENLAEALALNSKLNYLNLGYNPQSGQVSTSAALVKILEHSKLINYLNLDHMNLGQDGLKQIAPKLNDYSALKYLNLAANNINYINAEGLASLLASEDSTIEHLDLSENPLTVKGLAILVEALSSNTTLRYLDIKQVGAAGKEGGECLAKLLTSNNSIAILSVQNNALNYIGTKLVSESLKGNKSLVKVNIAQNNLDEAGGIYIAKALELNHTLTVLDLANNNIQSAGTIYLAAALSTNKQIQYLNLSHNQINNDGIEALASVMIHLKALNLSHNQITEVGAKFLATSLESGLPLTSLILDNNPLQLNGVVEILTALKTNYYLSTLGISGTGIGDQGIEQVVPLILENIGIAILHLGSNNINMAGAKHLAELLRHNGCLTKLCLTGTQIDEKGEAIIKAVLVSSSIISLTGLTDKSGEISIELAKNVNLLQENLKKLTTEQVVFNSKALYILVKQLQSRDDAIAPELSYADMKDNVFYLKKIDELFRTIKTTQTLSVEIAGEAKKMEHQEGKDFVSEDRFIHALESINILGDLEFSDYAVI